MEKYSRGDPWDLPDDPHERKQRASEIAADICDNYDEITHEFMSRILERVREEARRKRAETSPEEPSEPIAS